MKKLIQVTVNGTLRTMREWSIDTGVLRNTLYRRYYNGLRETEFLSGRARPRSNSGHSNIYLFKGIYTVRIRKKYRNAFCKSTRSLNEAIALRDNFIIAYKGVNSEH